MGAMKLIRSCVQSALHLPLAKGKTLAFGSDTLTLASILCLSTSFDIGPLLTMESYAIKDPARSQIFIDVFTSE